MAILYFQDADFIRSWMVWVYKYSVMGRTILINIQRHHQYSFENTVIAPSATSSLYLSEPSWFFIPMFRFIIVKIFQIINALIINDSIVAIRMYGNELNNLKNYSDSLNFS